MDFLNYIRTLNIITIPVLIRANSAIAVADAQRICVERVERVARENPALNVWLELIDLRDGNRYTIFSSAMMAKYAIANQINLALDMVAIRQAIAASDPSAIRQLIADEIARLPTATSVQPSDVADALKADQGFLDSIRPSAVARTAMTVRQGRGSMTVRRARVVLAVRRKRINMQVELRHAA